MGSKAIKLHIEAESETKMTEERHIHLQQPGSSQRCDPNNEYCYLAHKGNILDDMPVQQALYR